MVIVTTFPSVESGFPSASTVVTTTCLSWPERFVACESALATFAKMSSRCGGGKSLSCSRSFSSIFSVLLFSSLSTITEVRFTSVLDSSWVCPNAVLGKMVARLIETAETNPQSNRLRNRPRAARKQSGLTEIAEPTGRVLIKTPSQKLGSKQDFVNSTASKVAH